MKKIIFKVSTEKNSSIASLIKEVNKISCRLCIDLENGFVEVENVNDTMIDSVIELINNYYTILGIEINNTFEENAEEITEKEPTILEPQSKDDLIIKKVEFENEYVENRINSFLKTAYWAMYSKHATEKEIGDYILTCMSEISMKYSSNPLIEFSIGDIVDVNYGSHLPGEIIGGHVTAIVCNILNENMAYVVPITQLKSTINSPSYLSINLSKDTLYNIEHYKGNTILLDKGKYVRIERFNCVVGKVKSEFFSKVLHQLASTFDFTNCLTQINKDDINLSTEDPINKSTERFSVKKIGGEEAALLELIGFAFDKLDSSKTVEEQIESFLTDIGMTTTEKMVTQSFIIACDIKKINYENIILRLHEEFPKEKEEIIKNVLKETFKNWLEKYPTLSERCPKISLMAILKVFAKRFA